MYKYRILIFLLLFVNVHTFAQNRRLELIPKLGLSKSTVMWTISGDISGNNPNYLSELNWKNYNWSPSLELIYRVFPKISLSSTFTYTNTFNGKVKDTDFALDNKQGATYSETFNSNTSNIKDFNLNIDYNFIKKTSVLIGFNHTKFYNSLQHVDYGESSYNPVINEIQLGFLQNIPLGANFTYLIKLTGGKNWYTAYGNWTKRDDLQQPKSFEHETEGHSAAINNILNFHKNGNLTLGIETNHFYLFGRDGIDKANLKNGGELYTKLNTLKISNNSIHFFIKITI